MKTLIMSLVLIGFCLPLLLLSGCMPYVKIKTQDISYTRLGKQEIAGLELEMDSETGKVTAVKIETLSNTEAERANEALVGLLQVIGAGELGVPSPNPPPQ